MTVEPVEDWIAAEAERLAPFERGAYDQHLAAGNSPAVALANAFAAVSRSAPGWLIRAVAAEHDLSGEQRAVYDARLAEPGPDNAAAALAAALQED